MVAFAKASPRAQPLTGTGTDTVLVLAIALLLVAGLVMVASASVAVAQSSSGDPLALFRRQALFVLFGLFAGFVVYRLPIVVWQSLSGLLFVAAIVMLCLVLVPGIGIRVNGAARWLDLGVTTLQVSELTKLLVIFYLAGYLVRHRVELRENYSAFFRPLVPVALVVLLLLFEPDLGAAVVLTCICLGMIYLAGVRLLPFFSSLLFVTAVLAVATILEPYRVRRLLSFQNPWDSAASDGYQLTQSLIAIGSGSWFGVGLGGSVQKMHYLPEQYNDFLFAVLAEELGLVGVTVILLLFATVILRSFMIGVQADRSEHKFGAYLVYGIALWIGMQALINIGVNMGVLPTKGLVLPFMSAGGSAMIVMLVSMALVLRVDLETRRSEIAVGRRH